MTISIFLGVALNAFLNPTEFRTLSLNMSKELELDNLVSKASILVNSFGGYPIGYGLGIIILPLSTGWIQNDPYVANIAITTTYAIVGFTRSYFLRRIFEKYGIDDNFIRLAKRGIVKLSGAIR